MLTGPAVCCGYLEEWETPKDISACWDQVQLTQASCIHQPLSAYHLLLLLRFGVFPEDKPPR